MRLTYQGLVGQAAFLLKLQNQGQQAQQSRDGKDEERDSDQYLVSLKQYSIFPYHTAIKNTTSIAMPWSRREKKQYLSHYLHLMKIPAIIIIFIECLEVQVCSHKIRSWNRVSLLWDIMVIVLILRVKQKTSIDRWSLDEYFVENNISLIYQNIIIAFNTIIKYIFQLNIWSDCTAGVGWQHFEEEWKQRFCWWFHKVPSLRYNFAYIRFTRRHKLKHVSQMISGKQPLNII